MSSPVLAELATRLPLQEKVANFIRIQREKGRQVKSELRASRQYRNPDFLTKMVEAVDVREAASNFPPELFDPEALHKEVRFTQKSAVKCHLADTGHLYCTHCLTSPIRGPVSVLSLVVCTPQQSHASFEVGDCFVQFSSAAVRLFVDVAKYLCRPNI